MVIMIENGCHGALQVTSIVREVLIWMAKGLVPCECCIVYKLSVSLALTSLEKVKHNSPDHQGVKVNVMKCTQLQEVKEHASPALSILLKEAPFTSLTKFLVRGGLGGC